MNHFASFRALVAACAALPCAAAWAQPSRNPLYTPVQNPAPSLSSSQALHDLAKEARLSFLADADDLDQTPTLPVEQQPADAPKMRPLRGVLNDWSDAHALNWKKMGDGTLLAWSAPDPLALLARWKTEARLAAPSIPTSTSPSPAPLDPKTGFPARPLAPAQAGPSELSLSLSRLLADANKDATGARTKAVVELPEDVRQKILALAPLAPASASQDTGDQAQVAVLSDEFWQSATLHLKNFNVPDLGPDGKPRPHLIPILFVSGHFPAPAGRVGSVMLGLTQWPQAPVPQPHPLTPPVQAPLPLNAPTK